MVDHPADSGYELILDNRKLIITFIVLVISWGSCFVLGFMEGKRQGYQAGAQTATETASTPSQEESLKPTDPQSAGMDSEAKSKKEDTEAKPLNWYKDVSGRGEKPEIASMPDAPKSAPKAAETRKPAEPATKAPAEPAPKAAVPKPAVEPARKTPAAPAASASSSYSVQVGAFRQRQQAEVKAQLLKSKGIESRIEPPKSPEDLYRLKVGPYKTRAEAVAMQIRLKKSGFGASFIAAN